MPRPRKTNEYESFLSGMALEQLKILERETRSAIRIQERAYEKKSRLASARTMRDRIRIGQKVSFSQRGKQEGEGTVVGIFSDKIQVQVNGRKRSVSLLRVLA